MSLSLSEFKSALEPRMYLDYERNRIGDVSPRSTKHERLICTIEALHLPRSQECNGTKFMSPCHSRTPDFLSCCPSKVENKELEMCTIFKKMYRKEFFRLPDAYYPFHRIQTLIEILLKLKRSKFFGTEPAAPYANSRIRINFDLN